MLGCLHPILIIAAGLSLRSPFVEPFDHRDEARAARKRYIMSACRVHAECMLSACCVRADGTLSASLSAC